MAYLPAGQTSEIAARFAVRAKLATVNVFRRAQGFFERTPRDLVGRLAILRTLVTEASAS